MKWIALVVLFVPAVALADPCTSPLPSPGSSFTGTVRYIGDGDSICVGKTSNPSTWIEVRIADFFAPELHAAGGQAAKETLARLAFGKSVSCLAGRRSYDRVVAECRLDGISLGVRLKQSGVGEGGRGYRTSR